jgi:CRISPR-associated protein Csm2
MAYDTRRENQPQGQRTQQRGQHAAQQQDMPPQFSSIKLTKPLDPELFNSKAQNAARSVRGDDDRVNKPTQLRRFYDELVLWETRTTQQPEKFDEYLPFIRMLNAKAAYAEGRKLVDRTFVSLLQHTLAEVKDAETLTACKLFWEAFTGFYKQERPN